MNEHQEAPDLRSRWGRATFGGGKVPALWVAAPVGVILAVALAALFVATHSSEPQPLVGGVALALTMVWTCTGLVWVLIVDRDTVRGATKKPEQSIESVWFTRAASGAFTDTLLTTGLGTAAIAFAGIDISATLALSAVIVVAMASFAVRYFTEQRRG